MDKQTETEIEAAAFRRLVHHFQTHPEVQNIDLMILADFCRNCLSKWYQAAAHERGFEIDYGKARELVYGMPYDAWKEKYQQEATAEQMNAYQTAQQARKKK